MDDLISRQAAINAIDECYCGGEDSCGEPWIYKENAVEAIQMIERLPSAQPYTEAEIQKMQELEQAELQKAYECGRASAQPEIIHCKDCKHFEYDHPYIIQGVPVLGHEVCSAWGGGCKTDENGYCFLAERRTDEQIDIR